MDTAPTCVLAFVRRLLKCFTHWATVRKMCTCQGGNYMDTRQTSPTDTVTCIHTHVCMHTHRYTHKHSMQQTHSDVMHMYTRSQYYYNRDLLTVDHCKKYLKSFLLTCSPEKCTAMLNITHIQEAVVSDHGCTSSQGPIWSVWLYSHMRAH